MSVYAVRECRSRSMERNGCINYMQNVSESSAATKQTKVYFHINLIYMLFLPLIAIGKIVRHTIMYDVLVAEGVGHAFLRIVFVNEEVMEEGPGAILSVVLRLFGMTGARTYYQHEIIFSIVWNLILLALLVGLRKYLTPLQTAFLVLSIMVLNIFAFAIAKEPIQMLYFVLAYIILCSRRLSDKQKFLGTLGVMVFASLTFRVYYWLIVLFMPCAAVFINIVLRKSLCLS